MKVVVLYNPNSTGKSKENAQQFADDLRTADIKDEHDVELRATAYAGHAEEIAASYAKSREEMILISSSGDGGYHEVVNGALSREDAKLIVGVLPSGNANDHHGATENGSIVETIMNKSFRTIDVLKLTGKVKGSDWTRYAHSYAGIGVVSRAAKELTEDRPNVITEKWLVAKALLSFRYVRIREGGETRRYSSVIFSNIDVMSKVVKLAINASLTDGKFEINRIRYRSKLRLILYFLTAATIGLGRAESTRRYSFTTTNPLAVQLDGEVYALDARSDVVITSEQQHLKCI